MSQQDAVVPAVVETAIVDQQQKQQSSAVDNSVDNVVSPADALVQLAPLPTTPQTTDTNVMTDSVSALPQSAEDIAIAPTASSTSEFNLNEINSLIASNSNPNGSTTPTTEADINAANDAALNPNATKRKRNDHQVERRQNKKQRSKMTERIHKNLGFKKEYFAILGKEVTANLHVEVAQGNSSSSGSAPKSIRPSTVQQILLWVFRMCTYCPDWFKLEHRPLVENTVLLVLDGLTQSMVDKYYDVLTFMHDTTTVASTTETKLTAEGETKTIVRDDVNEKRKTYLAMITAASLFVNIQGAQHLLQCSVQKIFGYKRNDRVGRILLYGEDQTQPNPHTQRSKQKDPNFVHNSGLKPQNNEQKTNGGKISIDIKNPEHQCIDWITSEFKKHLTVADVELYSATYDDLVAYEFPLYGQEGSSIMATKHDESLTASVTDRYANEDDAVNKLTYKPTLPLTDANALRLQLYDKYPGLFKRPEPLVPGGVLLVQESTASAIPVALNLEPITDEQKTMESNANVTTSSELPPTTTTSTTTEENKMTDEEQKPTYKYALPSKTILDCPCTESFPYLDMITPETPGYYTMCALDCEMVVGENEERMLARFSLIDSSGILLVDGFVKPSGPVVDWVTQWSGISEDDYNPEKYPNRTILTFEQAREILLSFLSKDHFLVGHGLENDLRAMKITHTKILDTTLLYPHRKGGKIKNSLKYLSSQWLRETIQQGSGGHDSIVDALAALKLTMKKIVHGPKYGITSQHSMFDVLDFFNVTSHLLSTPEICRRLAAAKTNCYVKDIRKLDPMLSWAQQYLTKKYKEEQKKYTEKSEQDQQQSESEDEEELEAPTHPGAIKGEAEAESSPLEIDQDEKNCIVIHSSELLDKTDPKWEDVVLKHYCVQPNAEQQEKCLLDRLERLENLNESIQLHIDRYIKAQEGGEDGAEETTPAPAAPVTAPTTTTTDATATTTTDAPAAAEPEQPVKRISPPHFTSGLKAFSKFRDKMTLATDVPMEPDFKDELIALNEKILQFYSTLPPNTLFVVCSGQGSTVLPRFVQQAAREVKENSEAMYQFNTLPQEYSLYIQARMNKLASKQMEIEKAKADAAAALDGLPPPPPPPASAPVSTTEDTAESNSNDKTQEVEQQELDAVNIIKTENNFMHNPKYLTPEEKAQFIRELKSLGNDLEGSAKQLLQSSSRGIAFFALKK